MQSKRYEYAVHNSSGLMVGGTINFLTPTNISDATVSIIQEAASIALSMGIPFDPFNLRVAIKPLSRKKITQ
jgi:hypothetical protein